MSACISSSLSVMNAVWWGGIQVNFALCHLKGINGFAMQVKVLIIFGVSPQNQGRISPVWHFLVAS